MGLMYSRSPIFCLEASLAGKKSADDGPKETDDVHGMIVSQNRIVSGFHKAV